MDSTWFPLISALIVLIGTMLTLRDTQKRFDRQLAHDREQKATDREVSLRKDGYGKLAEDIVKFEYYLGRGLPLEDPSNNDFLKPYHELVISLTKAGTVASQRTAAAAQALIAAYGLAIPDLLSIASSCHEIAGDIRRKTKLRDDLSVDCDRLLKAMRAEHESGGQPDDDKLQALNRAFQFQRERIEELSAELDELADKNVLAVNAYGEKVIAVTQGLEPDRDKLMSAMRHDLGIHVEQLAIEANLALKEAVVAKAKAFTDAIVVKIDR